MDGRRVLEQVKGAIGASVLRPEHISPGELRELERERQLERQREEQEARIWMP